MRKQFTTAERWSACKPSNMLSVFVTWRVQVTNANENILIIKKRETAVGLLLKRTQTTISMPVSTKMYRYVCSFSIIIIWTVFDFWCFARKVGRQYSLNRSLSRIARAKTKVRTAIMRDQRLTLYLIFSTTVDSRRPVWKNDTWHVVWRVN